MDVLALIFPKEKKFYRMVEKQVLLVDSAVKDFQHLVNSHDKLSLSAKKKIQNNISNKEKEDDRLYTEMVKALKSTFITPIDREDLLQLVSTLDLIIDIVETVSLKLCIFKIKKINPSFKKQIELLTESFSIIKKLIFSIRNDSEVENSCLKMRKLEQAADKIYIELLTEIYSHKASPIEIIKLNDLYSSSERMIDKIHEASLIIENIAVKYS